MCGIVLRCERSGKHLIQVGDGRKRWTKDIVVQEEPFTLKRPQAALTPDIQEAIDYVKAKDYISRNQEPSSLEDKLETPVHKTHHRPDNEDVKPDNNTEERENNELTAKEVKEVTNLPRQTRSGAIAKPKLSSLTIIEEPQTIEEARRTPREVLGGSNRGRARKYEQVRDLFTGGETKGQAIVKQQIRSSN
ncbi:hypothetical protein NDN08_003745 [Rhodosorus marinus]|uniref:Ribosome biogenesis protein NOP53 n=1 Tax=Rhodosorus marinus TaxID=101924 RepID=A0AAV8UGC8_9RHOD|nr:hypothetical protein NDN08_003745 [Rhodosorus marinus]